MRFEAYTESYLMDSLILGALHEAPPEADGIMRYPMDQHEKIPLINFPGFSPQECFNVYSMGKQVLIESFERKDLQYGEVSITYDGDTQDEIRKDDCAIVYGTYCSAPFLSDHRTREILQGASKASIVTMHNHPNDTPASLRDMFVFSAIPKIRLMDIIHPTGEVDIMLRHERIPLRDLGSKIIALYAENARERKKTDKNPVREDGSEKDIFDYLTAEEISVLHGKFLEMFAGYGISYYRGISEENVREAEACLQKDYALAIERRNELEAKKAVESRAVEETLRGPEEAKLFQSGQSLLGGGHGKASGPEGAGEQPGASDPHACMAARDGGIPYMDADLSGLDMIGQINALSGMGDGGPAEYRNAHAPGTKVGNAWLIGDD